MPQVTQSEMYEMMAREFFGVEGMKISMSGFTQALFSLAAVCDGGNLARLRSAFPEAIDAFVKIQQQ